MSKQTYKVCFCFRRRFKLALSEAPEEIKGLFGSYSENGIMDGENLKRFLEEVQMQNGDSHEEAHRIIDAYHERSAAHFFKKGMTLDNFFKYLFSDLNPAADMKCGVHNDMTAPLSHYFIYTGHNSYLTGNQLSSDCSDVPIIEALQKGVRVIELDIWPNSSKDDVNVLHGRTLTAPVKLIKCLKSIKKHAFDASEYPVVITLEDHLTPDLQAKVAKMITETFGDTLYVPEFDLFKEFPSPESLKRRVMISTKPPKKYVEKEGKGQQSESSKRVSQPDAPVWGKEISAIKYDPTNEKMDGEEEEEDDVDDPESVEAPEYKRLIAIHAGKPKGGLDDCLMVDPEKVRRLSLSEQQLLRAAATHGSQIIRFTHRNILRVYPKGTRIDSSNYNPLLGWSHGAQMVAFNMQGYGRSLWLMQGLFRANGGCGYVKKPDFLLHEDREVFNPTDQLPVKKTLKVKVYMGEGWYSDFHRTHFDMFSPPDFYTRVGIEGVAADSVMKKTKAIEDSWIPVWNEEFEFPLTVPELAILRVEVHEYDMSEKDDFGGQTCILVSEIQEGIRSLPLYSEKGEKYPNVKVLMRFEFV